MTDWATIASFATAGGTLVLAAATFSAVRSSSRTARIAEEGLLASLRPLLVPSQNDDPPQKVMWSDLHKALLPGGRAVVEVEGEVIYVAIGLRNAGSGLALLHGWYPYPGRAFRDVPPADVDAIRRLTIDLYIPVGGSGYFEAAVRDLDDPVREGLLTTIAARELFTIDLLYGDLQGRQRTISRFTLVPTDDGDGWFCRANRHWNLDTPEPR